jgi:predicted molibdopterin-dependent oxidoreductase YjgC
MELRLRGAKKNGASIAVISPRGSKVDRMASIRLYAGPEEIGRSLDVVSGRLVEDRDLTARIEQMGFEDCRDFLERVRGVKGIDKNIENICRGLRESERPVIISATGYSREAANLALVLEAMQGAPPGLNFAFQGCNTLGALETGFSPGPGGRDIMGMVNGVIEGSLKALFVMENDPWSLYPDHSRIDEALQKMEFLVVQDLLWTPTADRADLILPSSSHYETSGTFVNYEGRVQRFSKVFDSVKGTEPGWEILKELAVRMGLECDFDSPLEVMEDLAGARAPFKGMDFNSIGEEGKRWNLPSMRRGFYPPSQRVGRPPAEYPYLLLKGSLLFGSEELSNRAPVMEEAIFPVFVEVSAGDAKTEGISDGEEVLVRSVKGEFKVRAKVSKSLISGVVFMPEGLEAGLLNNLLTEDGRDFVRIERWQR